MRILEKINDVGNRLSEQKWDELSKYKMSISGPDIEWIIAGSKSIGDYKLWFFFSITEQGKVQTLKILLFNHCRYDKPVCIYQKLVSCTNRTIKLAKLGRVKTKRFDMPKVYKIFNFTIEKTATGKYYASICIETEVQPLPRTGKQVGFDLGLKDLLIGSDGTRHERPKFAYAFKDKLAKEQRKLSKMRTKLERANLNLDECKNYQKQKRKVAKLHEHVVNCAKDFNHKLSRKLVKEYDLIVMEDLNVEGMKRNHYLAYSISDVRWSQLLNFIQYKCLWYEKEFIQVDRFYASSKICSCCGTYHKDIVNSLKVREWTCPDCGTHHDRDVNAATNILNQALSVA